MKRVFLFKLYEANFRIKAELDFPHKVQLRWNPKKKFLKMEKSTETFLKKTYHDLDFLLFICFIKLINQSIIFKNYL